MPNTQYLTDDDEEVEDAPPQAVSQYAKPGPYVTTLAPQDEQKFQDWVKAKSIPFDPSPNSDYDMRGYYQSVQKGDPSAKTSVSEFDGLPHFPDTYKTPYHKTFSNESRYANPDAPHWEENRLVDKDGKVISDETPKGSAPTDAAMDDSGPGLSWVKSVDPANGKTVAVPAPKSGYDSAASNFSKVLSEAPVRPEPKWWQRVAAAGAGAAAGYSNAASRTRNPIDIQAMGSNILAPGYQSKLDSWRSRVAPAQAQLEIAGQQQTAQQKAQETAADIAYKQAHANYMNGQGRTGPMVDVTPEMAEVTNGVFKAGTKIPASTATEIARIAAGKYEKPERTIPVTDPDLAGIMGVKVGTAVPYGLYQSAVGVNNRRDPADKQNTQQWIADSIDPSKTPAERALAKQKLDALRQNTVTTKIEVNAAGPQSQGMAPPPGDLNQTGESYLKSLPTGIRGIVKAIVDGRQAPISGYALMNPRGQGMAVMSAVNQYDPGWSDQRAQIRKAFTTGPEGRNIGALNTATVHLDRWHEAAKAMNNGSWQPGNQMYNYIAQKFGSAAPTNHAFVMNALAGEAASALKGNATDPEIAHVLSTLKPDLAPAQAQGVTEEGLRIFGDKLNTYDERYHAQSAPDDQWSPVLPSAKAVFQRYRQSPLPRQGGAPAPAPQQGHFQVAAPNGQPLYFPTQAQADSFKKAHGLK